MLNRRACVVSLLVLFLFIQGIATAGPAVEIIPVAVWQGRSQSLASGAMIDDLRKAWPDARIAHAVSAAPFLRGDAARRSYKERLNAQIRIGDDIVLHMAPWKTIADKASVSYKYAPTLFGVRIAEQECTEDCGLDLSFSAFSSSDVSKMIAVSRKIFSENDMGSPAAVYFEEGATSDVLQSAARRQGIVQNWSGIEMSQLKSSLGRFPVYHLNRDYVEKLPLGDYSRAESEGLFLDHVRYGVHAEIADMESSLVVFNSALEQAKKSGRLVRIPIVFNVDDLYYTHEFVREAVLKARDVAMQAGVQIVAWTPQNLTWSLGNKTPAARPVSLVIATQKSENNNGEAVFVSQEESELDRANDFDVIAH